jgi:hypothetical protein
VKVVLALALTLVSACCLNVGYLIEHSVASRLPRLTLRQPVRSLKLLLGARRWLTGFGIEATGWGLFVVALWLAPLSLVQAAAAGGIGILAVLVSQYSGVLLSQPERIGVGVSVGGLAMLGASLAGGSEEGPNPSEFTVGLWLCASFGAALICTRTLPRLVGGGAAHGVATGILFSAGDVATKMTVEAGWAWPIFVAALIICYALGTGVLQAGFQRGGALATAGLATLLTNALPIAAGMTVFGEPLPNGFLGVLRVASFLAVIAGAVLLARRTGKVAAEDAHTQPATA